MRVITVGATRDMVCESWGEMQSLLKNQKVKTARKKKKLEYLDITATFDTETTNTPEDGFIYSYQMTVGTVTCVVRYYEDFIEILKNLSNMYHLNENRRLVLYVHNLGYEYWYLCQLLADTFGAPVKELITKPHKPLTITYSNGIEFRDSLKLFQKSLAGATKNVLHAKLVGDLDYTTFRTPDTVLTDTEMSYCIYDTIGLREAIDQLKRDHHYTQASIPYTNTGIVREAVKNKLDREAGKYTLNLMKRLRIKSVKQLKLAYLCGAGGDTHASRFYAGKVHTNCNSYDLKSAHPSQMCLWQYPISAPLDMASDTPEEVIDSYAKRGRGWLGKVYIYNSRIKSNCPNPTVSASKCESIVGCRGYDNGRIMGAKAMFVYMDSNDWERFKQAYDYDEMLVVEGMTFKLGYLPKAFRDAVYDFFKIKESAPDGPDRVFAKICVNSIFGVCYQKPLRDEYSVNVTPSEIMIESLTWQKTIDTKTDQDALEAQENGFPFLWGLWTASLSRLALWRLQRAVGWDKLLYWDTDSCKYVGGKLQAVDAYNARIIKQCKTQGYVCQNRKGKTVYIGIAEDEHPHAEYGYQEFVALHAKCYADRTCEGDLEITVAGVSKVKGVAALHNEIRNLQVGLFIADAGGNTLAYHNTGIKERTDFNRPTVSASYIHMTPRQYMLMDSSISSTIKRVMECDIIAE